MIKVSIIVPVYNTSKYLDKCLEALVNQTLKEIEIIVVNDGSTDNSLEIINKYSNKNNNIIVINQENQGISMARNNALNIATGKYIGFVDSDDYCSYDMFEKLYNNITANKSDIVICNYIGFYPNSKEQTEKKVDIKDATSLKERPELLYEIDYAPWNKLYKRSLWNNIRYPKNLKYEDINAIIKVFLKAKKISYEDSYLYYYMTNPKGETQTINERVFDIINIFEDLIEYTKPYDKNINSNLKYLCVKKFFDYNQLIINNKNIDLSFRYIEKVYYSLDKFFNNWKIEYIKKGQNIKTKLFRCIQCNKQIYKLYIKRKMSR